MNSRFVLDTASLVVTLVLASCAGDQVPPPRKEDSGSQSFKAIEVRPQGATLIVTGAGGQTTDFEAIGELPDGTKVTIKDGAWSIDNPVYGAFKDKGRLEATGRGGRTKVRVSAGGAVGEASITFMLQEAAAVGSITPADVQLLDGAVNAGPGTTPSWLYPTTGTMIPPNLAPMELQYEGARSEDAIFRLSFKSEFASVSIATDSKNLLPAAALWRALLSSSQGGKIEVTLRSAVRGGTVAEAAPLSLEVSIVPLSGTIYYWATGPDASLKNGIVRLNFESGKAEDFYTEANNGTGRCSGCHALSRDGRRLMLAEYDAAGQTLMRGIAVSSKEPFIPVDSQIGDFFTWEAGGARLISSWQGTLSMRDTTSGAVVETLGPWPGERKASHPDWSPRDNRVALALFPRTYDGDYHFCGGSIAVYDTETRVTKELVRSVGDNDNNYYPAISPDGQWIVFNKAGAGNPLSSHDCAGYANPTAELYMVPIEGGTPVRLAKANSEGQRLSNSWAKWGPASGSSGVWWLAFSTNRDYGRVLINSNKPERKGVRKPQIWISAVRHDGQSGDPSSPAFWLPGQDSTSGNHLPYWTASIK